MNNLHPFQRKVPNIDAQIKHNAPFLHSLAIVKSHYKILEELLLKKIDKILLMFPKYFTTIGSDFRPSFLVLLDNLGSNENDLFNSSEKTDYQEQNMLVFFFQEKLLETVTSLS